MGDDKEFHVEKIPNGKEEIEVRIPRKNYLATLMPK